MKLFFKCVLMAIAPTALNASGAASFDVRVAQLTAKAETFCRDIDETFTILNDHITDYDFDNDGIMDLLILNEAGFMCSKAGGSPFQGSAGSTIHLLTNHDHLPVRARDFAVAMPFGETIPVITFLLHGMACDMAGYVPCLGAATLHDGKIVVRD